MYQYAEIEKYKTENGDTQLLIRIPEKDISDYLKRYQKGGIVKSELRLDDPRYISSEQRKKAYATIADIADWYGDVPEYMKELLKAYFIIEKDYPYFSLSNCSITKAREFIDYLIEFCFMHNVPLIEKALSRTDNVGKYLYLCLKYRKCVICGKDADLHHVDVIGRGHDRRKVDDSKKRKMALCREHHIECHTIGQEDFNEKYHVFGILYTEEK